MQSGKSFNRFFELYHQYENWADLFNFSLTMGNPSPGTIDPKNWDLYKSAMGAWCKMQYAIWLCDKNGHKTNWGLLKNGYAELCESLGLNQGSSIFDYWRIEEEDEDGPLPQAFDIVYGTVTRYAGRHAILQKIYSDLESFNPEQHKFSPNTNGQKLLEFVNHYKNIDSSGLTRHKMIKYLLFKKHPGTEPVFSLSLTTPLNPLPYDNAGKNKYLLSGLWGGQFKATMSIRLFELPGASYVSENYLFGQMTIKFNCDKIFQPYMWANLFDEDCLLKAQDVSEGITVFSPLMLNLSVDGCTYEREPLFNFSFHLSEIYDKALLSCGKRSFIPFDGDTASCPDDDGRFLVNSPVIIYLKERGHDTETEHLQTIFKEFFKCFSVVHILSSIQNEDLTGGNSHAIADLKALFAETDVQIREIIRSLDLNTKDINAFLSDIYNSVLRESVISKLTGGLEALAYTDNLTKLNNRNFLDKVCIEKAGEWAGFCIDIDHFKKVNDTYGHDTGDLVLREVSDIIQKTVKGESDREIHVFRLGGEEIGVLTQVRSGDRTTQEMELEYVAAVAEHIRHAVESYGWESASGVKKITVSIGVSGCITTLPINCKPDFKATFGDSELYLAKEGGRNKVVVGHLVDDKETINS